MILVDISLLIYAHNADDERFERASAWFEDLMNSGQPAFCWETINGFIRVSTNRNALPNPYTLHEAFSVVDEWLKSPNALFLEPASNHLDVLKRISLDANAVGSLYSDAVLAAYAISHSATMASPDRDFRLFKQLKLMNPLAES